MRHIVRPLVGLLLALAPLLAWASGIGTPDIVQYLVLPAAITGLVGGIVTGASSAHPARGIAVTIVAAMAVTLGYYAWTEGVLALFLRLNSLVFTLVVFTFGGLIVLAVVFFVAYEITVTAKDRILRKKKASDTAL